MVSLNCDFVFVFEVCLSIVGVLAMVFLFSKFFLVNKIFSFFCLWWFVSNEIGEESNVSIGFSCFDFVKHFNFPVLLLDVCLKFELFDVDLETFYFLLLGCLKKKKILFLYSFVSVVSHDPATSILDFRCSTLSQIVVKMLSIIEFRFDLVVCVEIAMFFLNTKNKKKTFSIFRLFS